MPRGTESGVVFDDLPPHATSCSLVLAAALARRQEAGVPARRLAAARRAVTAAAIMLRRTSRAESQAMRPREGDRPAVPSAPCRFHPLRRSPYDITMPAAVVAQPVPRGDGPPASSTPRPDATPSVLADSPARRMSSPVPGGTAAGRILGWRTREAISGSPRRPRAVPPSRAARALGRLRAPRRARPARVRRGRSSGSVDGGCIRVSEGLHDMVDAGPGGLLAPRAGQAAFALRGVGIGRRGCRMAISPLSWRRAGFMGLQDRTWVAALAAHAEHDDASKIETRPGPDLPA